MIVKIFPTRAKRIHWAVTYNTGKIDSNMAELTSIANFGPLLAFSSLRPSDYINYLQMVNNQNRNVKKPEFHVVISGKERMYDKSALTRIAENWLKEMGYECQPYLIVFHKDTNHNHVHIVSTRVRKNGKLISNSFDFQRATKGMDRVLGYDFAFGYRFSTRAQFMMLLENQGYLGRDPDEQKIRVAASRHVPDKLRAGMLTRIFERHHRQPDFKNILHDQYGIDLVFHPDERKSPDGYTILDHQEKQVFKGIEVMPLQYLSVPQNNSVSAGPSILPAGTTSADSPLANVPQLQSAGNEDDQQILTSKSRHR